MPTPMGWGCLVLRNLDLGGELVLLLIIIEL